MTNPILLDTDIATDPDDVLALLTIASSPEIDLVAVTATYGDTIMRSRIARQYCDWIDLDPTIAAGPTTPLSGRPIWYAGNEQRQIDHNTPVATATPGDAVDVIIDASHRHAGELSIIAIGPLTNIATALSRDPELTERVKLLSVMGGDFDNSNAAEHNLRCDAEAARIVLEAPFKTRIIGVEQTRRLPLLADDLANWARVADSPLQDRLDDDLAWWQQLHGRPEIFVHDPLAVMMVTHPELFTFRETTVTVDTTAEHAGSIGTSTGRPIHLVDDMDVEQLRTLIIDRVRASLNATKPTRRSASR